ncbi:MULTISPECIES: DUF4266 domain-containing protein [unclassified Duganella]|uniref:DUF4266 domain-containing protein n=1 Tax=unclassified Duganella TaxID=2636909 RepID=UPI000874EFB0|nr:MULTISPECIES: DUF4266 domain-containing protein [unclassified Duganella]OEZ60015.1 hypothetical protein DUGA6_32400 [Duganella sp. HH105]OFA01502.1 hypothetical protein DUGA2_42370 [Duganella sp. HH101]
MKTLLLIALAAGLSGCASLGQVQPWEKGTLARTEMTFSDGHMFTRFDDHIYTSREASSGGAGVGGGGCGCN